VYVFSTNKHSYGESYELFVCFLGVTTLFVFIFHSPVAGFSLLILEVS
jgi:hypothetical protein